MEGFWTERREDWTNNAKDARSPWETDYGRIVHSSSFRRLQGKTQILNLGDSDFYRTRLTHSIEVAQIARGLSRQIEANYSEDSDVTSTLPEPILAQAIGSTHDLGHPPFGHGGEVALNYCMRNHGGFEGNGQTLRELSKLERFSTNAGSNLTRRTLLGVLKYPVPYSIARNGVSKPHLSKKTTALQLLDTESCKPPKCYHDTEQDIVDWILDPLSTSDRSEFVKTKASSSARKAIYKSFDCSIMDLADDIAYGVHDVEDVVTLGLLDRATFSSIVTESRCASFLDDYAQRAPQEVGNDHYEWFLECMFGDANQKKRLISRLVGHFITNVKVTKQGKFENTQLDFHASLPAGHQDLLAALKQVVFEKVIKSPEVQHLEFKGQQMVVSVFEAYLNNPERLLPSYARQGLQNADSVERFICDHVAGMTDGYLLRTYDRLFSPRMGSTFDRL